MINFLKISNTKYHCSRWTKQKGFSLTFAFFLCLFYSFALFATSTTSDFLSYEKNFLLLCRYWEHFESAELTKNPINGTALLAPLDIYWYFHNSYLNKRVWYSGLKEKVVTVCCVFQRPIWCVYFNQRSEKVKIGKSNNRWYPIIQLKVKAP